ncbi:MAG: FAD-dependent monooxygenase [Streptosporangiaceae bacterium]|nr:FAD-dependent monooxygenase [Streptosporangiaceae bacterium]
METLDVLVVGAGPTGLVMASELLLHGAAVRLIEARRDRLDQSRAPGIQPRSLELFDRRGLARELISRGESVRRFVRYAPGHKPVEITLDMGARDTRFPAMLMVSQTETEDILERHLASLGGKIEREVTLTGLRQETDGVDATVRHADGNEELIRVRYLVGADGIRSTVRHLLEVPFAGESYPQSFLLADLAIDGPLEPGAFHMFVDPRGIAGFLPLQRPAPWRIIALEREAPPEEAPAPTLDDIRQVAAWTGLPLRFDDPVWISRFRVHLRMAAQFRRGRVFLAGDAAHVHSPAGGQGLNTGIGDAWNLGWKLALVAQGQAPDELLDSYEAERMPVARFVLRFTDRMFSVMVSSGPLPTLLRRAVTPSATSLLGRSRTLRHRVFRNTSQLGIEYRRSPIVAGTARRLRPRAGERLPDVKLPEGKGWLHELLDGPGHHLLVCQGPSDPERLTQLARRYQGLVTVVRPPEGTLGSGLVLVRPDGYVAFRGTDDLAALEGYLARRLRPAGDADMNSATHGR